MRVRAAASRFPDRARRMLLMKRVCLMAAAGSVDGAKRCSRPSDGRQMSRTELGAVAFAAPPKVVRTIGSVLTGQAGKLPVSHPLRRAPPLFLKACSYD